MPNEEIIAGSDSTTMGLEAALTIWMLFPSLFLQALNDM
jgi:hypothetical protein